MFARRLVLSLFLGAVLVGVTVGVAGAGGFKLPGFLGPFPPFLNTTLPADCQAHFNTDNTEVDCTASLPNPDPRRTRRRSSSTSPAPKVLQGHAVSRRGRRGGVPLQGRVPV